MKKNKNRQKKKNLPKTQEEAEVFESQVHLTQELKKRRDSRCPDFLDLKLQDHHYIFVYGTLKSGNRLAHFLDGCPYLGDARTCKGDFNMSVSKGGAFPIIEYATSLAQKCTASHVCGEVYVVDALKMLELDVLEGNTVMYNRVEHWVWLDDQSPVLGKPNLRPAEKVHMYVGNPLYWQGRDTVGYPFKVINGKKYLDFDQTKARQMVTSQEPLPQPYTSNWNNWVQEELDNAFPLG